MHCYTSDHPLVSIIFPTARMGESIEILSESMNRQDYPNIEVIILDEVYRTWKHGQFKVDAKWIECPPKAEGTWWNLDRSLNEGVKHCNGEIVIELNDYIWVPDDGVSKFVKRHIQEGPCLVTGVGHQYDDKPYPFMIKKPSGKKVFTDPRMERLGFYVTQPVIWEGNWASVDRKIIYEIGGWDEDFDVGWGYDNVNFAERAQLAGYNIFIDTDNEVYCFSHINLLGEKPMRAKAPHNQDLWSKKNRQLMRKEVPWKLSYLD